MPICTTCTQFTPYLYTEYESAYNLRLEQCSKCHNFVDPYVEHDTLTLLLDLILMKRGVYRHLLYNRGTEPRKLVGKGSNTPVPSPGITVDLSGPVVAEFLFKTEKRRWLLTSRLGALLVALDGFIRWSYLNSNHPTNTSPWTEDNIRDFLRVLLGCFAETVAFHIGIMVACYLLLATSDWLEYQKVISRPDSDIRREFRLSLIPLSLFYSSVTKLFLLFLLTIWLPTSTSVSHRPLQPLSDWSRLLGNNSVHVISALESLDGSNIDREWIVRNVLGGMSAGFGLRVILDIHPFFTTIIILAGWVSKTIVANLISGWVGGDQRTGEAWLAYSIP